MSTQQLSETVLALRLKREKAQTGAIQCSLLWNDWADLDLCCHVQGEGINDTISYSNKKPFGQAGGWLDVDMNAGGKRSVEPVENIFFKKAPAGKYTFFVKCFGCNPAPKGKDPEGKFLNPKRKIPFRVFLRKDGKVKMFTGSGGQGSFPCKAFVFQQAAAAGNYVVFPPQVASSSFASLCAKYKVPYEQGNGYYAIARKETIHAGKHLMLQDVKKDKFIDGSVAVRKALGWESGTGALVKKPEDVKAGFRCFVQSTSANRVVPANTHVLFEVSSEVHKKFRQAFSAKFLQAEAAKAAAKAGSAKAGTAAKEAGGGTKRKAPGSDPPTQAKSAMKAAGKLTGKNICFTGALTLPRSQAAAAAKAAGATVLSAVSKNVHILVAGPGAGSKVLKASGLGIATITEDAFKRAAGV